VTKRDKRLKLSKETIQNLMTPVDDQDLMAAVGGSCTSGASTAGGSRKICCDV
jgi:hypothetical protein